MSHATPSRLTFAALLASFTLMAMSGCATPQAGSGVATDNTIGTVTNVDMAVFQTAVNQKCQSELQTNQYWRTARVVMTSEQQTQIAGNICGCVSEKAPQSVTITDLATATLDPNARAVIVTRAVSNTLNACVQEWASRR